MERENLSSQERLIYDALKKVIDPEIGESVIDLGLIYGITVTDKEVQVTYTTTSLACPMPEMLVDTIHYQLKKVIPVEKELTLNLVTAPPWSPEMISIEARERLGWT